MLTAAETGTQYWQDVLGEVQLAVNCTTHRVTKASPLEMLLGKVARPLRLLPPSDIENDVDLSNVGAQAEKNVLDTAVYDKERFDKSKAKVRRHNVGDFVLLKNEERHQTNMSPKFKELFEITQVLEGDRYILKSLTSKRTYKYAHEDLRILPDGEVAEEPNVCDDYNNVETENENI